MEVELTTGDDDCPQCGGGLRRLGEDVTEELEYPHQITDWTAKHFEAREFASKGNGYVSVSRDMIAALDRVRAAVGHPIRITSGYRDSA